MHYVAFLRGINVGGRIVKMDDLRSCFSDLGFIGVQTILQTGNVVFESDTHDRQRIKQAIEAALTGEFQYPAKVQVLTMESLAGIVENYPFDETDSDSQHYVLFLENNLSEQLLKEAAPLDDTLEAVALGDGVVYWRVKKGMTVKSPFSKLLTKATFKDFNTNRNINTLRKICALAH